MTEQPKLYVLDEYEKLGKMGGILTALARPDLPRQTFHGRTGPYLTRFTLREDAETGWKVMLHQFHRGDEDKELHSHPWYGTSKILIGGYREYRLVKGVVREIRYVEGDLVPLVRGLYHRVELLEPTCWTLVVHSPSSPDWDFLDVETGVKTPWKEFIYGKGLQPHE